MVSAIVRALDWTETRLVDADIIFLSLNRSFGGLLDPKLPAGLLAYGSQLVFAFPAKTPVDNEQSLSVYSREAALALVFVISENRTRFPFHTFAPSARK